MIFRISDISEFFGFRITMLFSIFDIKKYKIFAIKHIHKELIKIIRTG